jgi:hypothetical protein
MALTVLQIAQKFAGRQGLPQPSFVVGNSDAQVIQILGLLEEFCDDLVTRGLWEQNTRECVFQTQAQEDQGSIYTLADQGYRGMLPDTCFNRTQRLKIPIALSPEEWQLRKTLGFTGSLYQGRIRQDRFLFIPAPTAGQTIAFEYKSEYFVNDVNGVGKKWPTADSDTFIMNDSLPVAYLRWAWKSAKGLDYGEEFAKYELLVNQEKSSTRVSQKVSLDAEVGDAKPGLIVPPGSWQLSS